MATVLGILSVTSGLRKGLRGLLSPSLEGYDHSSGWRTASGTLDESERRATAAGTTTDAERRQGSMLAAAGRRTRWVRGSGPRQARRRGWAERASGLLLAGLMVVRGSESRGKRASSSRRPYSQSRRDPPLHPRTQPPTPPDPTGHAQPRPIIDPSPR